MKLLIIPFLLLGSCANKTATTGVPNSPQTQALNIDKTLADAINASVRASIAIRDQAKVKRDASCAAVPVTPQCTADRAKFTSLASTTTLIENWAVSAATLDDQIATELGSSDTWSVQKQKILLLLPKFQVPTISGLDPTIQAFLTQSTALISQITSQVTQ